MFGAKALAGLGDAAADAGEPLPPDRAEAAPADRAGRGLLPRGRRRRGGRLRDRLEAWAAIDARHAAPRRGPPASRASATARTRSGGRCSRSPSWPARRGRPEPAGRRSRSPAATTTKPRSGVLLLEDIRDVFEPSAQAERIATADLIARARRLRGVALGRMVARPEDRRADARRRRAAGAAPPPLRDPLAERADRRADREGLPARGLRRRLGAIPPASAYKGDKRSHPSQPAPHGQTDVTDVRCDRCDRYTRGGG